MSETFIRQWQMLRMIPRAPRKIDTATIQSRLAAEEGVDITLRSIQRDLGALEAIFPIFCDERSKPYGWSWLSTANVMDIPGMDAQTALTFHLAAKFLSPLLPRSSLQYLDPYFKLANSVLKQLRRPGIGNWPDKVRIAPRGQTLQPPKVIPEVLDVIYTALLEERCFTAQYRPRGERRARDYEINPLGLVFRDSAAYLIGTAWDYDDVIQFALHRFRGASSTDKRRRTPKGFSLEKYLQAGAFDYPKTKSYVDLKALFNSDTAVHLEETPLSANQHLTEKKDGQVLLEAHVQDTAQLRWWLLGFGDRAEVLGPPELREEIEITVRKMASSYGITR